MDPFSQGLLGAALPQSMTHDHHASVMRPITLISFVAGMLADLDVLIRSKTDPLLGLLLHRHFTHSILFIPIGGGIATVLMWPFLRRHLSTVQMVIFGTLGYATCGVLDACTSYGTYLIWPIAGERIAWDIIAIIDPVFTACLLLGVGFCFWRRNRLFARIGLGCALLYLVIGFYAHHQAAGQLAKTAQKRDHRIKRFRVMPTLGNLLLWRGVYEVGDHIFVDAIRLGVFSKPRTYAGQSAKKFVPRYDFPRLSVNSVLYKDILRFAHFADGYIARAPGHRHLITDLRYSLLPHQMEPLWGIVVNRQRPEQHVKLKYFRNINKEKWKTFWAMLRGKDLPEKAETIQSPP